MSAVSKTDYRAVNRLGTVIKTFGDADIGRSWVRDNASYHEGLELRRIIVTETDQRVYRPRVKPDQFAIPAYGRATA